MDTVVGLGTFEVIIAMVAGALALLQRALRDDVKAFPTISAPWRGLVVAVIGLVVTPLAQAIIAHASLKDALVAGVVAIIPTIMNVIGSLFRSRSTGPTGGAAALTLLGVMAIALATTTSACSAAKAGVCPLIKVASDLCPLVLVELEDGTTEAIPRGEVARIATAQRAARAAASSPDGGAK